MANVSKLTDEMRSKIQEVAALDGSVEEMAYYCDVSRQTIYNWLDEDKELFDKVVRLRERPILKARQTITKSLDDPNHAFRYLERKRRKEFGANVDLTTDGKELPQPLLYALRHNDSNEENSSPTETD